MRSTSRSTCIHRRHRRLARALAALAFFALLAPSAGAQSLNVDLGTHWGPPSSAFGGAAGQPGTWNEVGLAGSAGLLDPTGSATAVTMTITAQTDTGWIGTGSDDARALVEDNLFSSGGGTWTVSLGGLADGAYELTLYAPAHGTVASGDVATGTYWHPSIPGSYSGSFVEGTNVLVVDVLVTGGQLVISSGLDTTLGLAGLQLVELDYVAGFNVDLGTHWGPTVDEHGAASGQTGPWNEVGLAGSAGLVDVIGRTTSVAVSVAAQTDTGWTGSGASDAALLIEDNLFTGGGGGWTVSFSGLEDGSYEVYLYAPAHPSVPSGQLQVNGADGGTLSGSYSGSWVEGVNFARVAVNVSGGTLALAGVGDDLTGLAGVQVVPSREAPSYNLDFGLERGVPDAAFGAIGTPGEWQRLALGTHVGLRDRYGVLGAATVTVTAFTPTGHIVGGDTDTERLLDDNFFASGTDTWSVEITGIRPGAYELVLYAPSHPAIPTGPMTVNGVPVAELPGDDGSTFIQGTSWAVVEVDASEGRIDVVGGGVTSSGLSGLQIAPAAPPVPVLGPTALPLLVLGLAGLALAELGLAELCGRGAWRRPGRRLAR